MDNQQKLRPLAALGTTAEEQGGLVWGSSLEVEVGPCCACCVCWACRESELRVELPAKQTMS